MLLASKSMPSMPNFKTRFIAKYQIKVQLKSLNV